MGSQRVGHDWETNTRFKDGRHRRSHTCSCLQHQPSESRLSLECWKHLAHVGIFSDDSDFFCVTDNICVSKRFYLPCLPLSSSMSSHDWPQSPPLVSLVLASWANLGPWPSASHQVSSGASWTSHTISLHLSLGGVHTWSSRCKCGQMARGANDRLFKFLFWCWFGVCFLFVCFSTFFSLGSREQGSLTW